MSPVIPSLKYSCCGSPLKLVKGRTAMEGLSGKVSAGVCTEGMDADGAGGRNERCCTSTTVATTIASPATEKTPRRTYFREPLCVCLVGVTAFRKHPEYSHRFRDVFDRLLAEVLVAESEFVAELF